MKEPTVPPVTGPSDRAHEILSDPAFVAFARRKGRVSAVLTVIIMGSYFLYVGTLCFAPELLSTPVGSASSGIPLGIGVIVLAWVLTGIYVRWANTTYDTEIEQLKKRIL